MPQPTVYIVGGDQRFLDSISAQAAEMGHKAEAFADVDRFRAHCLDNPAAIVGCLVADWRNAAAATFQLLPLLRSKSVNVPVIAVVPNGQSPSFEPVPAGDVSFVSEHQLQAPLKDKLATALAGDAQRRASAGQLGEIRQRFDKLSDVERHILRLLLDGAPNKWIAKQLDMGLRTVELQRARLMRKLQVESVAQLVRHAIAAGVIEPLEAPVASAE